MTSLMGAPSITEELEQMSADVWGDVGEPATTLPPRPSPDAPPSQRRTLKKFSRDDALTMGGAFVSALATTLLIFGRLTPLEGQLGFVVVLFAMYVVTYAMLVSLTDNGPAVIDRVMTVLLTVSAATALAALFSVVVFVLWRGRTALMNTNFFVQDLSVTGPLDPLDKGGIAHAIVGTLIMTLIALIITVPLGVACSVYLTESSGRLTGLVRWPLHLRHLDSHSRLRTVRHRSVDCDEHHDAAHHHSLRRCRAAPGAWQLA